MKCKCGGKYNYDSGVIWCDRCSHVIYREHDENNNELLDYFSFFIKRKYQIRVIKEIFGLSNYVAKRVYYKAKGMMK